MSRYEATFEIESKADAHTARLLTERTFDALREELGEVVHDDGPRNETLQHLETIRDEARRQSPGRLTVVYEPREETFDD